MAQHLRRQLFDFLLDLPELQQMSAPEWRAFFQGLIGLERRLYVQIQWNGSQQAVVNDLLEHVVAEGRDALIRFCQKFDDESICGPDQRATILRLLLAIAQLSEREWEQEFALTRHNVSLGAAEQALERGDFSQALALLRRAVSTIPASEKRLAAKARYLQALALLGKDAPRDKHPTILEKIEDLLKDALALERCWAFIFTLASIKRDIYEQVRSASTWGEADYWQRQLNRVAHTDYDNQLLKFLERCQSNLYHQRW